MNVLEVFIFRGDTLVGSRVFSESSITVGRGNAALLRLDDKEVSRLHATITVDGARLVLRDEGSQIGTFVNGKRVRELTVRDIDTIQIGSFRLKLTRRSMGGLDFEEDEPTEAGQRRRNLQRQQESSISGVIGDLPMEGAELLSMHADRRPAPTAAQLAPTPTPAAAPTPAVPLPAGAIPDRRPDAFLPTMKMEPLPPAEPAPVIPIVVVHSARPARDDEQTIPVTSKRAFSGLPAAPVPPAAPVQPAAPVSISPTPSAKHDSPPEELSAGLEDSVVRTFTSTVDEAAAEFAQAPDTVRRIPPSADEAPSPSGTTQPFAPRPSRPDADPTVLAAAPATAPTGAAPSDPALSLSPARSTPASAPDRPAAEIAARTGSPPASQDTPLLPGAPAEAPQEEVFDEDDDDAFTPSFSLLEMLDEEPVAHARPGAPLHVEIIQHQDGRVVDVYQLHPRENFPPTGRRLVRLDTEGRAQLAITEEVGGTVYLNRRAIPLEEIRRGARERKGVALLELREGDHAALVLTRQNSRPGAVVGPAVTTHYHVRFVRLPQAKIALGGVAALWHYISGAFYSTAAFSIHLLVMLSLSLLPASETQTAAEDTRFAEVSLKEIQLEPPPEIKPPEPEPPSPEAPEPTLPRPIKPMRTVRVQRRAAAQPKSAQSALLPLENIKPSDSTPTTLKDVVTNINAVSVPSDVRSRFKVGGAIGKLPVGDVRLSTAGVARDTSSGRELVKGDVGALKGAGGNGNVRGVVKQVQAQLQSAGSGRLSKGQIQKVINEHVAQVQACYERALVRDHSLGGKVTFDWEIAPSGAVTGARVRSSTMAGSAVSSCILQEIRSWTFPQPEGGSVSVTYPFIFSAQGF